MKKQQLLNKIIIIAMFSALACAGTFIQIRMPAGDFVHLGNFVMIIAALLLGGVAGGCVGSLGMGLYDLLMYSNKPSTILRTFILKFIVGFLVGYLFRLVFKKNKDTKGLFILTAGLFGAVFISSLVLFIIGDKSAFGTANGFSSIFNAGSVKLTISIYIPVFTIIFLAASLAAIFASGKLSRRQNAALFAIMIAVFVNILGEFFLRWFLEGVMVSDFKTALITATSKIPGSVITGSISVILSILIYEPIYKAVKNAPMFKDDTISDDEDNANEDSPSEIEENIAVEVKANE